MKISNTSGGGGGGAAVVDYVIPSPLIHASPPQLTFVAVRLVGQLIAIVRVLTSVHWRRLLPLLVHVV